MPKKRTFKTDPVVVEVAWLLGDALESTSDEDFADMVARMRKARDKTEADEEAGEWTAVKPGPR